MTILELAVQSGLSPQWKSSTAGGEYHSSCPICGGKDRFYMQPYKPMSKCNGYYRCRQCGAAGDSIQFAIQFLNLPFQEAAKAVNATINEKVLLPIPKKGFGPPPLNAIPVEWKKKAAEYVEQGHNQLLQNNRIIDQLLLRGISLETIKQYKIGWSSANVFLSRGDWGLETEFSKEGKERSLWIPKGIIIPIYNNNGEVIRLKIRRHDWTANDNLPKYVAISGSMNGLSLIGETKLPTMIVVESELDAYAVNSIAHDFVFVVAIGSNIKSPDNLTDYLAKKAVFLLICHDNDEPGKKMLTKWQRLYPHAQSYPTPIGKDIGEAIQQGLNIRDWLKDGTRSK